VHVLGVVREEVRVEGRRLGHHPVLQDEGEHIFAAVADEEEEPREQRVDGHGALAAGILGHL
jgi:nucleoside-triphosphatase THEP1